MTALATTPALRLTTRRKHFGLTEQPLKEATEAVADAFTFAAKREAVLRPEETEEERDLTQSCADL